MWTMGEFECQQCGCKFLHDLPYSLGIVSPCTIELKTGVASSSKRWYASGLEKAYAKRIAKSVDITFERTPSPGLNCLLVNTLYPWYGDAVSLLLRINSLRRSCSLPVIVLINPGLRWLVPDWVEGVWVLERNFSENTSWNDDLTYKIKDHANRYALKLSIPSIFQSFNVTPIELSEFTKINSFPRERWLELLKVQPVVTYMIRKDRVWPEANWLLTLLEKLRSRSRVYKKLQSFFCVDPIILLDDWRQRRNITKLANDLKRILPNLEFTVCGLGKTGKFPNWINDLRADHITTEVNKSWVKQGARSHVLLGVLGSHTSLPGSLSGAYIELVPVHMLGNVLTTASAKSTEAREALFTHRLVPTCIDIRSLKSLILEILFDYPYFALAISDQYYGPLGSKEIQHIRVCLADRTNHINSLPVLAGLGLLN